MRGSGRAGSAEALTDPRLTARVGGVAQARRHDRDLTPVVGVDDDPALTDQVVLGAVAACLLYTSDAADDQSTV